MSAMPRMRRPAVKMAPVAMGQKQKLNGILLIYVWEQLSVVNKGDAQPK
jgi:hypothetical protein